ncbi:ABC transporter ATP-binding protein [Schaalia sp. 19OD2882]|uniref:ABC transporter ATP-binding protein n=1 Tax=Schaalia sp. 19OD2882 TaxID=2794089 RepID=UPI001C1E9962|nr:ABC transporter ATP-binding protein [Schaalia sp. 19OD2882]QWW19069.1 ABC transporter ATP-binding protein [Schaalia sp. 19OD2882]
MTAVSTRFRTGPASSPDPRPRHAASGTVPAVAISGLGFTYPSATSPALVDVKLDVAPGQIVALLGPNGAGKSTLVSLMLGLNNPDRGSVQIFGLAPRAAVRQGEIGVMLQSAGMADCVTVRELVAFMARQHARPMDVDEAIDLAGLRDVAGRRVERLSGGERQRVRFALALVGQPRLLILDEPTNEMDVASRYTFWNAVRSTAAKLGRTVFFTTHHMEEAATAADRVLVIAHGRVVADETPEQLRARAGRPQVQFRWGATPPQNWMERLSGDLSHSCIDGLQILHTSNADRTLRELVNLLPEAVDITIQEASLDQAYLSVIDPDRA